MANSHDVQVLDYLECASDSDCQCMEGQYGSPLKECKDCLKCDPNASLGGSPCIAGSQVCNDISFGYLEILH